MKITHYSAQDTRGGAALAAYRLHHALLRAGASSRICVREKYSHEERILQVPPLVTSPWPGRLRRLLPRTEIRPRYTFNLDQPVRFDPDNLPVGETVDSVSIIHWIDDFMDVASIARLAQRSPGPLIRVIHDLEPLTGGCHYNFGCEGYRNECGSCPQLDSSDPHDLSSRILKRKRDVLGGRSICFIAPTGWGEARVRESSIFKLHRVERIPLPIDTEIYRPYPRRTAREVLHLPPDRTILLCGASYLEDRRKGIAELLESLSLLSEVERSEILLLVVGLNGHLVLSDLPFPVRYLGEVSDPLMMALVYQSADLFLCPSLADSGPMMIPEAMLCGIPVVAFDTGGAPDWIDHLQNGYLARIGDVTDFADGIRTMLAADRQSCAAAARRKASGLHRPDLVARQHLNLYRELIEEHASDHQSRITQ